MRANRLCGLGYILPKNTRFILQNKYIAGEVMLVQDPCNGNFTPLPKQLICQPLTFIAVVVIQ